MKDLHVICDKCSNQIAAVEPNNFTDKVFGIVIFSDKGDQIVQYDYCGPCKDEFKKDLPEPEETKE